MEQEIRISYLCIKASNGTLSLEEECELLGYIAIESRIIALIEIEAMLKMMIDQ